MATTSLNENKETIERKCTGKSLILFFFSVKLGQGFKLKPCMVELEIIVIIIVS